MGAPQVLGQEVHAKGGDGHRLGGGRELRRRSRLVRETSSLIAASGIDRAHGLGRLAPFTAVHERSKASDSTSSFRTGLTGKKQLTSFLG